MFSLFFLHWETRASWERNLHYTERCRLYCSAGRILDRLHIRSLSCTVSEHRFEGHGDGECDHTLDPEVRCWVHDAVLGGLHTREFWFGSLGKSTSQPLIFWLGSINNCSFVLYPCVNMVSHPTALIAPSDSNYTYQYKFTYKETLLIPILWLNIDKTLVMQVCECEYKYWCHHKYFIFFTK